MGYNVEGLSPKRGVNVVANRHGQYADKDKRRECMRDYRAKRQGKI